MKIITRETMNDEIKKLKEIHGDDIKLYSISKLNNFNNCKRGFYYSYILKEKGESNVYSLLGSAVHEDSELYIMGESSKLTPKHFNNEWIKTEIFGIKFMNDKVKENYKKDIDEFYKIYRKPDGKFLTEIGFLVHIGGKNFIQGYIDLVEILDDSNINIYDIKTSSMFKGNKIIDASRQLILYEIAMNKMYDLNVKENGWIMVKYVDVEIDGVIKTYSNREWVQKSKGRLKKVLKEFYDDNMLIDMILNKSIQENSIDFWDEKIKNRVNIKINIFKYDVTEEKKAECLKYIENTVKNIENEEKYDRGSNLFFCKNLCGYYGKCNEERS